jgi:chorismate lyase
MKELHWQMAPSRLVPANLLPWLQDAGSFMHRLRSHGVANTKIKVLLQSWQLPFEQERGLLNLDHRQYVWVREVLIHNDDTVWMFARTIFPRLTLTGKEKRFLYLAGKSLGSLLFNNRNTKRSQFEFASVKNTDHFYNKFQGIANVPSEVWARRSIFHIGEKPILLEEFFLPSLANQENFSQFNLG